MEADGLGTPPDKGSSFTSFQEHQTNQTIVGLLLPVSNFAQVTGLRSLGFESTVEAEGCPIAASDCADLWILGVEGEIGSSSHFGHKNGYNNLSIFTFCLELAGTVSNLGSWKLDHNFHVATGAQLLQSAAAPFWGRSKLDRCSRFLRNFGRNFCRAMDRCKSAGLGTVTKLGELGNVWLWNWNKSPLNKRTTWKCYRIAWSFLLTVYRIFCWTCHGLSHSKLTGMYVIRHPIGQKPCGFSEIRSSQKLSRSCQHSHVYSSPSQTNGI